MSQNPHPSPYKAPAACAASSTHCAIRCRACRPRSSTRPPSAELALAVLLIPAAFFLGRTTVEVFFLIGTVIRCWRWSWSTPPSRRWPTRCRSRRIRCWAGPGPGQRGGDAVAVVHCRRVGGRRREPLRHALRVGHPEAPSALPSGRRCGPEGKATPGATRLKGRRCGPAKPAPRGPGCGRCAGCIDCARSPSRWGRQYSRGSVYTGGS